MTQETFVEIGQRDNFQAVIFEEAIKNESFFVAWSLRHFAIRYNSSRNEILRGLLRSKRKTAAVHASAGIEIS
mgnify:CR=1 FL=1